MTLLLLLRPSKESNSTPPPGTPRILGGGNRKHQLKTFDENTGFQAVLVSETVQPKKRAKKKKDSIDILEGNFKEIVDQIPEEAYSAAFDTSPLTELVERLSVMQQNVDHLESQEASRIQTLKDKVKMIILIMMMDD